MNLPGSGHHVAFYCRSVREVHLAILNLLPDLSMSAEAPTWVLLPQVRQDLVASWLCVADVHAAAGNKCMRSTGTESSHRRVHACNSQDKIWPPTVDDAATRTVASSRKAYKKINLVVCIVISMVKQECNKSTFIGGVPSTAAYNCQQACD